MLQMSHHLFSGRGCVLLDSRGSDDKRWLGLVGILGDMPWFAAVSLV